jgi:hypothetical protein
MAGQSLPMQISFHIGAHVTDGEGLLKSALKDADARRAEGVVVPPPGSYRKRMREAVQAWAGGKPVADLGTSLKVDLVGAAQARRIALSNGAYLCTPAKIFEGGEFYAMATLKMQALRSLFPDDEIEVLIATRNPATFMPATWAQTKSPDIDTHLGGMDPEEAKWSDLIGRMRAAAPDIPLVVWSNEDTPLIWGRILRRFLGVADQVPVVGEHDLLSTIITPEGMARFLAYMQTHPPASPSQMSRTIAAFLGKYVIEDEIEEDIEVPGWDLAMIDDMTNAYEVDLARIAKMDGVTYIAP